MGILTRLILGKDDYLFNNLKDNQKLAFCRIVNEVIKDDGVVRRRGVVVVCRLNA